MCSYTIIRAKENYEKAGAYSVRITGMNRCHSISLKDEFDDFDFTIANHILVLDNTYPIATARFYEIDDRKYGKCATIGRVVVLPEYRNKGLGRIVVNEAEAWAKDLGYNIIIIESRIEVIDFYKKIGYELLDPKVERNGVFDCIKMIKKLIDK